MYKTCTPFGFLPPEKHGILDLLSVVLIVFHIKELAFQSVCNDTILFLECSEPHSTGHTEVPCCVLHVLLLESTIQSHG